MLENKLNSGSTPDDSTSTFLYIVHAKYVFLFLSLDSNTALSNCTNFDVRLDSVGQVLVCLNNIWRSVRVNGLRRYAAEIICDKLGFQRIGM